MNTKLLRQKILDLAIRGKLTEQKKSDGTTKDLLKQIAANVILSNAKNPGKSKNTPKEIIPLDKSEAPFEIPENWEWVRLGDVSYIASGSTPSKDCFVDDGVPYLKMYNLRNQQIDFQYKPQFIKREIHEGKLARSRAKPYDVIMNIVGPPLGKIALIPETLPECNFNQAAVLIRAHYETKLMSQYIRFYLMQMDEINSINTKGTAGQENLSLSQTQNMRLPLPPLAEQQRIVTAIENAFAEITEIENNQELLKKHIKQGRQKILDLAIRGKLTQQLKTDGTTKDLFAQMSFPAPTGNLVTSSSKKKGKSIEPKQIVPLDKTTAPFEIPESWEWVKLGDVCSINQSNLLDDNLEVAFVPMTNVAPGYANTFKQDIRKWGEIKKGFTHFANGDVAVAKITPCFENRKSVLFKNLKNGFGAGTTELHILRPLKNVFNSYVLWFVKTDFFIQHGIGNFSGAVGQQRVGKDVLANVLFPLPPLAEQQRIVATIEQAFAEFDAMEKDLA